MCGSNSDAVAYIQACRSISSQVEAIGFVTE